MTGMRDYTAREREMCHQRSKEIRVIFIAYPMIIFSLMVLPLLLGISYLFRELVY